MTTTFTLHSMSLSDLFWRKWTCAIDINSIQTINCKHSKRIIYCLLIRWWKSAYLWSLVPFQMWCSIERKSSKTNIRMQRFQFEWLTLTSRLFRSIEYNLLLRIFSCAQSTGVNLWKFYWNRLYGLHFNWLTVTNSVESKHAFKIIILNFGRLWPCDFKIKKRNSN